MSQKSKILEYLKAGNSITTAGAVSLFQCYRLSERIREIKKDGYLIGHERETTTGGASIIRYSYQGHVNGLTPKANLSDLFPDRTNRHSEFI